MGVGVSCVKVPVFVINMFIIHILCVEMLHLHNWSSLLDFLLYFFYAVSGVLDLPRPLIRNKEKLQIYNLIVRINKA